MATQQYFSVAEVAERFSVPVNKVLRWIAGGELAAVDVSDARNGTPRWRINADEIERFESDRRSVPTAKPPRRTNRKQMADVIEFVK